MSAVSAGERLGRLLAIVPWIASRDGPNLSEVCARFDVNEKELIADLDLLFLCGVYPFTPDVLIDVDISGGRVWIRMADYFRRPLKLTSREALALAAVGRFYLRMPASEANGALASALAKLEVALGIPEGEVLDVDLDDTPEGTLETLRRATLERRKLRLVYYSFGRDATSERVVHPWRVLNLAGHWYLEAWCETAGAERMFRVDRMMEVSATSETFATSSASGAARSRAAKSAAKSAATMTPYSPSPSDATWVLDLEPRAHWVAPQYPNEGIEDLGAGVLRVSLKVGEKAWIERLLLRGGDAVTVVSGDSGVRSEAARRILERYRH